MAQIRALSRCISLMHDRAHYLPRDAPLILFAVARTAGWLAHVIEQATAGALIRPRAHYVGRPPLPPAPDAAMLDA